MERYNILIVDDEENILRSLQRSIRKFPFNVLTATSGCEAIEQLIKHKDEGFALIISDQRMPGMNGLEFLRRSKEIIPDTSRIMLTGYTDMNTAIDAINTGSVDYFMTKPWNDSGLHNVINRMVERYELIIKNRQLNKIVKQQNASLKKLNENLEKKVQERTREIEKQKNDLKRLNQDLVDKNSSLQKLYNSLEKSYLNTIKIFLKALALRNSYIANHCKRVAVIAMEVAKYMKFSEKDIFNIEIAGLLHDIGKIGLTNDVLFKSFKDYTTKELEAYKKHPIWGEQLIGDVKRLQQVGKIIRHHHENFDGSGYPDKLKANNVPLGSRIINICDFCDNIIHKNSSDHFFYGTDLKGYLSKMSGILFDPDIIEIYKRIAPSKEVQHII